VVLKAALTGKARANSFWAVEKIVGGVGDADFLVDVVGVAAGGGGFATLGIETLDGSGAGESALAIVADDLDEQPGNGFGIRRRNRNGGFAGNAGAVICLPGRSGEMLAEKLVFLVEKLSVGSFQGPVELGRFTFTGVDLVAFGV
jgi:hypothetical protein